MHPYIKESLCDHLGAMTVHSVSSHQHLNSLKVVSADKLSTQLLVPLPGVCGQWNIYQLSTLRHNLRYSITVTRHTGTLCITRRHTSHFAFYHLFLFFLSFFF